MVNTYQKGYRAEKFIKDRLEREGFAVWRPVKTRFGGKDIFGLFDLVAISKSGEVWFIQVKSSDSGFYSAKDEILRFAKKYKYKENEKLRFYIAKKRGKNIVWYFLKKNNNFTWETIID
jgi:Holliday junction resolvase